MADVEVTLNHSENYSESTAKKYRGYVINLCDNSHVDDGTWAVTSNSYTGYKINSNKIDVWNINTTSSDKYVTFTWTSSKVDGCTKTLKVTVPGAVVTLKSDNTEMVVTTKYNTLNGGPFDIYPYMDEFLVNGSSEGIVTTSNTVSAAPVITCNGGMSEYWVNYSQNNTNNKIYVSVNPDMYTYFIGCTGDYTVKGTNTINFKYYEREMSISFPVIFKFIHLANYKFYRHESTLVEISSISVTHKVDPNRTYNLNDIIRFGYYACTESPNDNSVSASLLTVSNLYIDRYFSSSSLVINDNDGEPSGCFYIGVKCNTKDLVKLFNDFTAFSAKFKFNLSYSNASIPVTIDIIKDKVAQYVIIFKKGNSTIESVELNQMPIIYAFNVYYRPKNSFEEQSASGIITSVSSSSTYYTAKFNGNTITLAQKIGSIGDVVPDDIEFDVRVCIKPSGASSDICNSLPVHFTKESSGGSSKSITINWSVSYPDGLMIYNYNTSIDLGLTNYVNSDATSGSIPIDFAPYITSRDISVNFSLRSAGYSRYAYSGKKVSVKTSCDAMQYESSTSGNSIGCCLGNSGAAVMFTSAIDFTSNFNGIRIIDGLVINISINLSVV